MADLILKDFLFSPTASREGGPSADPEVRQRALSGKGLRVSLAASHAGMVNMNNVMYSPQGMRNSDFTWTYPLPRPMQVHHDDMADPIGRIIGARFAPYNESQVSSDCREAFGSFRDAAIKDDILSAARMIESSGVLRTDTWKGVGELVLDAIITDASAIEKILDGRYLGISITQRPMQAFCSICEQDWLKDGPCSHERGEIDEDSGRKMYLIVGDTKYVEASYVNQPADDFAQTIEANAIQFGDSIKGTLSTISDNFDLHQTFTLVDSFEETSPKEESLPLKEEDSTPSQEEPPEKKPEMDSEEEKKEEEVPSQESEFPELEETVAKALELLFANGEGFDDEQADIINEAVEELIEEDAKLSTKQRKALPGSSFCGPNKSFPVNDCAHYTAAKRLIGRYKGPGDKSRILSCIESKGKKLGCGGEKKKDSAESPPETPDKAPCLDCMSDKELGTLYLDCEKLMVSRNLKFARDCKPCEEKSFTISSLEEKASDLEGRVVALRDEWKIVTQEHVASEDAHAKTLELYESLLVDYLKLYLLLTDKEKTEEAIVSEVSALSFHDLRSKVSKLDFSDTISFIRSGISREPELEVTPEEADSEVKQADFNIDNLRKTLQKFRSRFGESLARDYFVRQQLAGKIPKDLTLAKVFEPVAE